MYVCISKASLISEKATMPLPSNCEHLSCQVFAPFCKRAVTAAQLSYHPKTRQNETASLTGVQNALSPLAAANGMEAGGSSMIIMSKNLLHWIPGCDGKTKTKKYNKMRHDLLHNVDAVVNLLPLKKGVQVVEKGPQVVLPVPVRNNDGCVMPRSAVGWLVVTARRHQGVPAADLLQGQGRGQVDGDRPHWKRRNDKEEKKEEVEKNKNKVEEEERPNKTRTKTTKKNYEKSSV